MSRILAPLLTALALASPVDAQDVTFTAKDDAVLTACLDAVNASEGETAAAECIGIVAGPCQDEPEGWTTVGMVNCLERETAWWDARLNENYAAVLETLDDERTASLRKAQRAWLAFRDAECGFQYDYWREGTIRSVFGSSCMLELTARRAIDISHFLDWTD